MDRSNERITNESVRLSNAKPTTEKNLKDCIRCGIKHNKRGPYCTQACANRRGPQSEELRKRKSVKLKEYHATPEGAATRSMSSDFVSRLNKNNALKRAGEYVLEEEDWMLDTPLSTQDMHTYDDDDNSWL